MKLGIFGGTFDPIHRGHMALACAAKEQFALDCVLFVVAMNPPHKTGRHDLTPAPYRYRMVEIAIESYPGFRVSDIEINRSGMSYTVDTLKALKQIYFQAEFYLILGADTFLELPTWNESDLIRQMVFFLVARRPGTDPVSPYREGYSWLDMPEFVISSSDIRRQIHARIFPSAVLPAGVGEFIQTMNLYRDEDD